MLNDMNTIYLGSRDRAVEIDTPIEFDTVEVTIGGETITPEQTDTGIKFNVPLSLIKQEGLIEYVVAGTYSEGASEGMWEHTGRVEIVRPIVPISKVIEYVGAEEAYTLEYIVRKVIEHYTGQSFGYFDGDISITGSGERFLFLSKRLIKINKFNNISDAGKFFSVGGAGYVVTFNNHAGRRVPVTEEFINSGVISAPSIRRYGVFEDGVEYVINGEWGFEDVPADVQEAAYILLNDYACGDSTYRERFVSRINSADWGMTLSDLAFTSTGNVLANQLLNKYVIQHNMLVY